MAIINKGVFDADTMTTRQTGSDWPTAQVTTTADVVESSVNRYFTNARVVSALIAGTSITIEANGRISSAGGITPNSNVEGNLRITGTLTANAFASSGFGVPTLSSATNINLSANATNGGAVVIQNSPLRLRSYTTADRGNITAAAGDLIFNSNTSTLQFYDGVAWDTPIAGPTSSTDNAIARFNLTTGELIKNSVAILSDSGALSGLANITASGLIRTSASGFQSGNSTDSFAKFVYDSGSAQLDITNQYNSGGAGSTYGQIVLKNYDSNGGNLVERARITGSGNFLAQKCISVGGATPSSDGAGLTFPATQSASSDANTLDDYEEGEWTPTYTPDTGAFDSITYGPRYGTYQKIGNTVSVQMYVYLTGFSAGNASSLVYVTGLPFTSASSTAYQAGQVGYTYNWATNSPTKAAVYQGETKLYLFRDEQGAALYSSPDIIVSNLKNGNPACILSVSMTYKVA